MCSRLLALYFLSEKNNDVEEVLTTYFNFYKKSTSSSDYWLELLSSSILTKNIEIMSFLVKNLKLKSEFYYQREHLNSYYLMSAFYYKFTNNGNKEIESIKQFDISEYKYCYDTIPTYYISFIYITAISLALKERA